MKIMAKIVEGLLYSESHEWVRVDGGYAYIGITDYAQQALGAISYVEMPDEGEEFARGEDFGAVESVKAASNLYCPVSGVVSQINEELVDAPELLNQDAFANWIIKVELDASSHVDELMDAAAYVEMCNKL